MLYSSRRQTGCLELRKRSVDRSPPHHSGRLRVTKEAGRLCPYAAKSHLNLQPLTFSAPTETSPLSRPLGGICSRSNSILLECSLHPLPRHPRTLSDKTSTYSNVATADQNLGLIQPSTCSSLIHIKSHTLRKHRQLDRQRCRARLCGALPDPWIGISKESRTEEWVKGRNSPRVD
jgi:hypothetical protein